MGKGAFLTTLVTAIALGVLLALNPTDRSFFSSIGCISTSLIGLTSLSLLIATVIKYNKIQRVERFSLLPSLSTQSKKYGITKSHSANNLIEDRAPVTDPSLPIYLTAPKYEQHRDQSSLFEDSFSNSIASSLPYGVSEQPSELDKKFKQEKEIEEEQDYEIIDVKRIHHKKIQPLISGNQFTYIHDHAKDYFKDFEKVIPSMIESTKEFLKAFLLAYWRSAKKKVDSKTLNQIDQQMNEIQKLYFSFIQDCQSDEKLHSELILTSLIFEYLDHEKIEDFVSRYPNQKNIPIPDFIKAFPSFFNSSDEEASIVYSKLCGMKFFSLMQNNSQSIFCKEDSKKFKEIFEIVSKNIVYRKDNIRGIEENIKKNQKTIAKSLLPLLLSKFSDVMQGKNEVDKKRFIALQIDRMLREELEEILQDRMGYLSIAYSLLKKHKGKIYTASKTPTKMSGQLLKTVLNRYLVNKAPLPLQSYAKKIVEPTKELIILLIPAIQLDKKFGQSLKSLFVPENPSEHNCDIFQNISNFNQNQNGIDEALQPKTIWEKTAASYVSVVNDYTQKMNSLII
ncbi:MAG: hypothetical protein R3E91_04105 [Chlamydiales bacterium]